MWSDSITHDNVQGYSVHIEPNELDVALTGVGGHSVHGHEKSGVQANRPTVVDRIGLRSGGDERIVSKISRLDRI